LKGLKRDEQADGPPLHADLGYLGRKLEKVTKKKNKTRSSSWSLSKKKRSTDVSFPKKGRQLFVAVKMAPPFGNF
jgi:hypothetical protein